MKKKGTSAIRYFVFCIAVFYTLTEAPHIKAQNSVSGDSIVAGRLRQISIPEFTLPYSHEIASEIKNQLYLEKNKSILGSFFIIHSALIEELTVRNMPLQLMVLPIVMSEMNILFFDDWNKAGLWGLGAAPAVRFGLKITPCFDERYNRRKAMPAALDYLEFLYEMYQDWWVVLLAYTNGPSTADNFFQNHENKPANPLEMLVCEEIPDKNFIYKFIFYNYLINFYDEHHIIPIMKNSDGDTIVILDLEKKILPEDFFEKCSTNVSLFRKYNPEYISGPIDTGAYTFHVNQKVYDLFLQWKDSLYLWAEKPRIKEKPVQQTYQNNNGEYISYTIKSGDNLGAIAVRYGVTVSQLKQWNNLKSDLIHPGQKLKIYTRNAPVVTRNNSNTTKNTSPKTSTSNDGYITYTVKQGDSLWSIAQKFEGVSDEDIKKLNNISGTTIYPGQVLKIKKK